MLNFRNKRLIFFVFLITGAALPQAEAKVCVGYDQIAALMSAGANHEKERRNQANQPSLMNPPVMRAMPVQRQSLGDGVLLPDNTRELQQRAYEASRAGLDQQALSQKNASPQGGAGSSRINWGTLSGMIPSGGGGKCRGICY